MPFGEVTPDLELREAVARRLGWVKTTTHFDLHGNALWTPPGRPGWPERLRPFEQCLAACEAVLEWLTGHGWEVDMIVCVSGCRCDLSKDGSKTIMGMASKLPRAVCEAFVQVPLEEPTP